MDEEPDGNASDLIFGLVGIVWCVVVVALVWTFVMGLLRSLLGKEDAKHEP